MGNKWFMVFILAAVLAAGIVLAASSTQPYIYEPGFAGSYTYNLLLNSGLGLMLGAAGLGIVAGAIVGRTAEKASRREGKRLSAAALFNDWGFSLSALAGVILITTGFALGGILSPRLVGTQSSIAFTLNMHFVGIIILLFGGLYTISRMVVSGDFSMLASIKDVFSPGKKGENLPSFSWAVWSFIAGFAALAIKGTFLVVVHLFGWPESILVAVSAIHDVLAVIALALALVAVYFLMVESAPAKARLAPKPSKA